MLLSSYKEGPPMARPAAISCPTSRCTWSSAIFFGIENYEHHRNWLAEAAAEYGCLIHAYVLMTNQVHLLVTPERAESLPPNSSSLIYSDPFTGIGDPPLRSFPALFSICSVRVPLQIPSEIVNENH